MTFLRGKSGAVTAGLIGFLFFVEFVSGILQGFYVPLIPDLVDYLGIRDADFNVFEGAQLLLSALVVPVLAKLGDMYGHKKILLVATVLTAGATWWLVPHRLVAAGVLRRLAPPGNCSHLRQGSTQRTRSIRHPQSCWPPHCRP